MTDLDFAVSDDFVSFEDIVEVPKPQFITVEYDRRTNEYYRILRSRKMDPFISIDLDDHYAYKYPYIWDPYTGIKSDKLDKDGPLCFHPDVLIHYFYKNRLNNLWVEPVDDLQAGYFEGYYDMAVGAGENIHVVGRNECPEKYLFRLPIIDCYLTKDHSDMVITMGPKLTDADIDEIYNIALKNKNSYRDIFGKPRPNLVLMKQLYDQAISKTPYSNISTDTYTAEQKKELFDKLNRIAVDKLKAL